MLVGSDTIVGLTVILGLTGALLGCSAERTEERADALASLVEADDGRGSGTVDPAILLTLAGGSDTELQAMALRALGRLEDPGQINLIAASLSSPSADVRAEAVNALGQAVFNSAGDSVLGIIRRHLAEENDPAVLGVLGRTLGRMQYDDPSKVDEAEDALRSLLTEGSVAAPLPTLTGAVMGLEWLARRNRGRPLGDNTVERLNALTGFGLTSEDDGTQEENARVRRVALMALMASGSVTEGVIRRALSDPDADARRLALAALPRSDFSQSLAHELSEAQEDPVARVRAQVATALAAIGPMTLSCPEILEAAKDPHPQVATAALDLLAGTCAEAGGIGEALEGIVEAQRDMGPEEWHRGAHALLALAGVSPEKASPLLPEFLSHENPFARGYAARTATRLGDAGALEALSQDEDGNVRTAAIQGLFRLLDHDADPVILGQLDHDNPELVLTAAGLLEGTPYPAVAVTPLLDALARMSVDGRDTYRDPRMGILDRLEEVAGPDDADALEGYLTDYDPEVAQKVAEILSQWTGTTVEAHPVPSPRLPLPTPEEMDQWVHTRVILEMEGSGVIEISLFPFLAPTNVARFVRLAGSGYFDGLTFHRVVSNFVLQGGSPHANEMSGDALFSRDEMGLQSHWRGTVGTSTRGRDTGDGQIFINLVDNLRLDHNYTVFGEVVEGMDVVDRVVEGQRILRARVEKGVGAGAG